MKESILLNTCCAHCLCYPLSVLKNTFNVTAYFCGSNIHPYKEYHNRHKALVVYSQINKVPLIEDEYKIEDWFNFVTKYNKDFTVLTKDKKNRCKLCYLYRFEKTAKYAKEIGCKFISSTLLYSVYQYHDLIKECGENIAKKYNLTFYYEDFRKGWQKGFELYNPTGLYKQKYCGCTFS